MFSLDYVDESVIESCKKAFRHIYPEFKPNLLGVSQDKDHIIVECEFPDGTFYFRVNDYSVSHGYTSKEDADRA